MERKKMRSMRLINLLLLLVFLTGCGMGNGSSATLPTAQVTVIHVPSAEAALRSFLDSLLLDDYTAMYSLLTAASRQAITQEEFTKHYTDDLNALSATTIEYIIQSILTEPQSSQASFSITYIPLWRHPARFHRQPVPGRRPVETPMG
jgi:hypothetical protein